MFGDDERHEMDKPEKRKLANSIIGKEKFSGVEENSEPDDSNDAPSQKIEKMVIEAAHNGHMVTHHYVPPNPSASPEAATKPEHRHQPPKVHVFKDPAELNNHVGSMLKHMQPTTNR